MGGLRWSDGYEAWKRLRRWHERGTADGDAALDALSDVGALRRLLDEAELAAVRAARGRAKSWAEIATRLGVTRQSAWERWRDLDDVRPAAAEAAAGLWEATERAATELWPPLSTGRWSPCRTWSGWSGRRPGGSWRRPGWWR